MDANSTEMKKKRIVLLEAFADDDVMRELLDAPSLKAYIEGKLGHEVTLHRVRTLEDFKQYVEDLKSADGAILFCHANSDEFGLPDSTRLTWREFGKVLDGSLSDKSLFVAGCAAGAQSIAANLLREGIQPRLVVAPEHDASSIEMYPAVQAFCLVLAYEGHLDGQAVASLITGFRQAHLEQKLDAHEAAGHEMTDELSAGVARSKNVRFRVDWREGEAFSTYFSNPI